MIHATFRNRVSVDARTILRLSGPLIINNLATAGMTTADTIMAGWLGARDLAAVAVGASYVAAFYLAGLGLLMALSPTVAHAYGAGRNEDVGRYVRQALWLSIGVSVVVCIGLAFVRPALTLIGIPADVAALAARFVFALAFGIPAIFAFLALRFCSEGLGWTRPTIYTALIALVATIGGNYIFMYGKFGMPALGAVGCGVGTALAQWIIFAFMWNYVRRHAVYRSYRPLEQFEWPDRTRLREILALGLPISGSVVAEGGLFAAAGLMMGSFGASIVASHAIAINYGALMFMIPLSIHSATTIHVGHKLGRGDRAAGRHAGWVGIGLCVAIMMVSALVLIVARHGIAALYTGDPVVLALAAHLLLFAAAFQIADGLQVGAAGALRGFKDARVPMLLNVLAYWGLGFPLAYGLGVGAGMGPVGVWIGLIGGLCVCAVLLTLRFRQISR